MKTTSSIAFRSAADILLLLLATFFVIPSIAQNETRAGDEGDRSDECVRYQGAWFEICHPRNFTVIPSLPSSTAEGYDSARFVSPDQKVSFYVYAPQWGGQASDIAIDPEREVLVAEKRQPVPAGEVRWFTIAARDGSYQRSYRDLVTQNGSVRTIVGIQYRDADALKHHARSYESFRRSLKQYTD